ncbi:meiosis inhibitor protein 1 [Thalassophryne amazonica]|uniref:meiosis inhibitor protein 1 n=1 Tax=Thalassophryne amazonica TaxID=390379 RepID=UPI001471E2DB|nr:meiosis inhibitor protein 1 [Thalassophryne amazonica]
MTSADVIYEKIHMGHDPKWSGRLGPAEGGGLFLCVACVIEMMESNDIASVRKSAALSGISGVMKCSPGALRALLLQDHRVCLHFTACLLGMLHTVEDPVTLEQVDQVLVQLLLELQSEENIHFVLDEIHKQLTDQLSIRCFVPTFNFLGKLIESVPNLAQNLVAQYGPLLESLCLALLYPDEGLKASVLYVWLRLFSATGGSAAQSLPITVRDRVCGLLLQILANASSSQLINNCMGLLWQLVKIAEAVSVLMNSSGDQIKWNVNQKLQTSNNQILSQSQEQLRDCCSLPLLLKKLLLSGEEMLQMASAKCMATILGHSPRQYSAPFIKADVPEFLFERLASSANEVLLWSVYSCLLLLTEDPLFFSKFHSVYGIESLVRSLKEALRLTNLEVPKQGLLLLSEILERQPLSVRLFPSVSAFVSVLESVVFGVSSSCLLVATQAAKAASTLLRLNHQSSPVQYKEIEGLIEAITSRCAELPLPTSVLRRSAGNLKRSEPSSQTSRSRKFLLQAMVCFQAACRLAEECALEPVLKENAFTAPSKHGHAEDDSLECLRLCLLRCCDSVWIPAVTRMSEFAPSADVLQYFYSILSFMFTLLPSHMPLFACKLASSGFYRLALEHKGVLCGGNRNPNLNTTCCGFIQKLSMCLLSDSDPVSGSNQHDAEEVNDLLQWNLPSLCCHLSEWPSLMCEAPGLQLSEIKGPRATKYCLVIMLHIALQQGDRLLPDQTVFSSVVWLLRSVEEHGLMPRSVLRSALYLLAVTQDKNPNLDLASLNSITKELSSCNDFCSLYIHHPPLLHFIYRYPELAERFGTVVLELWLARQSQHAEAEQTMAERQVKGKSLTEMNKDQEPDPDTMELLILIKEHPAIIVTLLGMVCTKRPPLSERALEVLAALLHGQRGYEAELSINLRPALLQALQRISVENSHGLGRGNTTPVDSLPLVLRLLCVTQATDPPSSSSYSEMDGVQFKLFYHVSTIAGKLTFANTAGLLPALSYLHCCLSLSPAHCTDRASSVLLSNSGLMDLLQTVLSSSSTPTLSPTTCSSSALLFCCHLLLSSLVTSQHIHATPVHKKISWSLERAVQCLVLQKSNTDSLLLVSSLRLLQALLDVDLVSEMVCVSTGPDLVGPRPLGLTDGALYPLGSKGAQSLTTALTGCLLQKDELLLRASVNCLGSLLSFIRRKSPTTAKNVVCQTWRRFQFDCLLNSGENWLLHPATLTLITLLLQHGSAALLWDPDLLQVMEAVERRGVTELSHEATQAVRLLLAQVQSEVLQLPLTEEHRQKVRRMMESLKPERPAEFSNRNVMYPSANIEINSHALVKFTKHML